MAARDRYLLVEEDGGLWLLKREGAELRGRVVSREGVRHEFPGLYKELLAGDYKDAPKIIVQRPR